MQGRQVCTKLADPSTRAPHRAVLTFTKEYAMSGANRPSGPATRKSLDLADQIERDEMKNNLPDAQNDFDEDDIDEEAEGGRGVSGS